MSFFDRINGTRNIIQELSAKIELFLSRQGELTTHWSPVAEHSHMLFLVTSQQICGGGIVISVSQGRMWRSGRCSDSTQVTQLNSNADQGLRTKLYSYSPEHFNLHFQVQTKRFALETKASWLKNHQSILTAPLAVYSKWDRKHLSMTPLREQSFLKHILLD